MWLVGSTIGESEARESSSGQERVLVLDVPQVIGKLKSYIILD